MPHLRSSCPEQGASLAHPVVIHHIEDQGVEFLHHNVFAQGVLPDNLEVKFEIKELGMELGLY